MNEKDNKIIPFPLSSKSERIDSSNQTSYPTFRLPFLKKIEKKVSFSFLSLFLFPFVFLILVIWFLVRQLKKR